MIIATILAGVVIGIGAPVHPHPHPHPAPPIVPHVAVYLRGGCSGFQVSIGPPMAFVEVTNTGNVAVGLGTRVTFPDVQDDGTLSVNGIAEYAIFAPGNAKAWAAQYSHVHLTVRYRGNEIAVDPETGETYPVIEQQDLDAFCR